MSTASEMTQDSSPSKLTQTIAITGASGLVGSALSKHLSDRGDKVIAVTRGESSGYADSIRWDPASGLTNPSRLEGVDTMVHLAGENIAGARWNSAVKAKIRNSRVEGTRNLVRSMAAVEARPQTLICASAIGFYGDCGAKELTEESPVGTDFLAEVCQQWETEADAAKDLGVRVVKVRIGVVLSPNGGALAKMLTPFKLGAGGVVGSGKQYWSWVGLHDLIRVFAFCIDNTNIEGAVNATAPEALTNRDFTKALGKVLKRPTLFPLPGFMAKIVLGEMAEALLLSSTRVHPQALETHGFAFEHADLESCLNYELGR